MEYTRKNRVRLICSVDNESLRIGVGHGYSPKMSGHLKSTAGASFQLLQASHVIPRHLPGSENSSDCLTKTLPATKLLYLIRRFFGLEYAGDHGDDERIQRGTHGEHRPREPRDRDRGRD